MLLHSAFLLLHLHPLFIIMLLVWPTYQIDNSWRPRTQSSSYAWHMAGTQRRKPLSLLQIIYYMVIACTINVEWEYLRYIKQNIGARCHIKDAKPRVQLIKSREGVDIWNGRWEMGKFLEGKFYLVIQQLSISDHVLIILPGFKVIQILSSTFYHNL